MIRKKIGIIGAAGYAGFELVKLLSRHPGVKVEVMNSATFAGRRICEVYPSFDNKGWTFSNLSVEDILALGLDMLFLATPHGAAMQIVPKVLPYMKVIDISPDYRIRDASMFEKTYTIPHADKKHLAEAVYGLPELFREKIRKARLVSNPGCYATAMALTGLPLADAPVQHIIFDCKSGYSGAGREKTANDAYQEKIKDNIMPYNLVAHRHIPEAQQFVRTPFSFTPHVLETYKGILCTAHVLLKKDIPTQDMRDLFVQRYAKERFVKILDTIPDLHTVQNTNLYAAGGFEMDGHHRMVIVSALDNLQKGASGQAVQNMNLMLGFEEGEGLNDKVGA